MTDFSHTDLLRLAKEANEHLAVEFGLHNLLTAPPTVTPGMVRAVLAAVDSQHIIARRSTPKPAPENPAPPSQKSGHKIRFDFAQRETIDDAAAPTQRVPAPQREPLDAEYETVKARLLALAKDGLMPTIAEYNRARPDGAILAESFCQKRDMKWSELAAKLGLAMRPRGLRFGKGKAAAPVPEPEPAVPLLRGVAVVGENGLVESVTPNTTPNAAPILHRAPDGGVTRILPRPDNSQAHSLPSAFAERNADGRAVRPAYRTED